MRSHIFTKEEIDKMQKFYNDGHTLREVQEHFHFSSGGYSRGKLIKILKTRSLKSILSIEERKLNRLERIRLGKQKHKEKMVLLKGGKCEKCGYDKCLAALTFHHLDPSTKDFTLSSTRKINEKVLKEIEKCQLLCCNCHVEVHSFLKDFSTDK